MSRIRIGISGWQYADWQGRFYPDGLPQHQRLDYLAQRFNTVEINGTFYSLKRPQHFRRYYEKTPRDFRFAVKGGRYITHMKRLKDVRTPLANHFASGVLELKDKLGPHLWQLPGNFQFDAEVIDAFLELLPRDSDSAAELAREHDERVAVEPASGSASASVSPRNRRLRHALEVRHPSFLCAEFVALLRRHRVALVFSHGERWPYVEDVTAGFVYVRLHGPGQLYASPYDAASLERWSRRVALWHAGKEPRDAAHAAARASPQASSRDVYVYFDNTDKVHAPDNAERMARRLGVH